MYQVIAVGQLVLLEQQTLLDNQPSKHDAGPTLKQHLVNVPCLLGSGPSVGARKKEKKDNTHEVVERHSLK